jgi:hypothetical protein
MFLIIVVRNLNNVSLYLVIFYRSLFLKSVLVNDNSLKSYLVIYPQTVLFIVYTLHVLLKFVRRAISPK